MHLQQQIYYFIYSTFRPQVTQSFVHETRKKNQERYKNLYAAKGKKTQSLNSTKVRISLSGAAETEIMLMSRQNQCWKKNGLLGTPIITHVSRLY